MMDVLLACGCVVRADVLRDFPHHIACEQHWGSGALGHVEQAVVAVEAREWHVKCQTCRFGRYCGQSRSNAQMWYNQHEHYCVLDYIVKLSVKNKLRVHYNPRRVRFWIVRDWEDRSRDVKPVPQEPLF